MLLKWYSNLKSRSSSVISFTDIQSKAQNQLFLARIVWFGGFQSRIDLTEESGIIQAALINFTKHKSVEKHKHLSIDRQTIGTSEVWIILKGKFEVEIFDIDNASVGRFVLRRFDSIILTKGGHSLKALKNNSKIYEIKNGPFFGNEIDKVYI
jgi:hypothetical protein